MEVERAKRKFWGNYGHNILELHIVLIQTDEPQVKRKVITDKANLVYEFSHELPNDLRVMILGNKKILGKY